ncbi:MAG: hypothetical protein J0L78_15210 [Planctomycetes bacterium]|nr:hypothetical protein [Planctomycetota bacterium]
MRLIAPGLLTPALLTPALLTPALLTLGAIALCAPAHAQNAPFNPPGSARVVLMRKYAPGWGLGAFDTSLVNESARTLEWVFHGSQISMFPPGSRIASAAFRNSSTSNGPLQQLDFADWSLTLSRSLAAPGSLSSTIAENGASDSTPVRSGPLTLLPGSIERNTGATAPFSFFVPFENAFAYSGGHLRLLMSHGGATIGGGTRAAGMGVTLDAAGGWDPDRNVQFQARRADSANAAVTTLNDNAPVTRLGVDAGVALPLLTATASNGIRGFEGALGAGGFSGQFVIGAEQLRHVPRGSLITWLAFRLAPGESAWPETDATTAGFEIEVATSTSEPETMGTFFGSNADSDAILVRDGTLTIPAGALAPTNRGATWFGMPIHFQRGFVYKGGNLCVTVRHAAFVGAGIGPKLDTARAAGGKSVRTIVTGSQTGVNGAFLPADDSIALELGYTPSLNVPRVFETESGGSGAWLFETPRVHQLVIDEAQLPEMKPGSTVDGIAFRISPVSLPAFVSWPNGDASVSQFDVTLSTAQRSALQMSTTFSTNEGPDKVLVRSGPLLVPSQAMKVIGSDVGEHSFIIPFTRPFVYAGGGLCITMRVGQRVGGDAAVNFDGRFNTSGVGAKRATASASETVGNNALAFATRLVFTPPVPTCPADLNADGVVDDADFVLFLEAYEFLTTPAADFDYDGATADSDFSVFVMAYDALVCAPSGDAAE